MRSIGDLMMDDVLEVARSAPGLRPFTTTDEVVNCHHNYVSHETHFGEQVFVTRKGAVRAGLGDLGIIPGSMGARSYIVRGLGNPNSFTSCSHGAGRSMSRAEARRRFTVADHAAATAGIECRKDVGLPKGDRERETFERFQATQQLIRVGGSTSAAASSS